MLRTDTPPRAAVVFDIGGTWFRSGLLTAEGELVSVSRTPAVSFRAHPALSAPELQQALVSYLASEVRRLEPSPAGGRRLAGISMGAALDGRSGLIWNSGPLWGPASQPFDLSAALQQAEPSTDWVIVNDITAALLWHVAPPERLSSRVVLLTVSTGIGARTWDGARRRIPLDRICGMQGEIGHLPITFRLGERIIERRCDCGGANHLNAFCSGAGIAALLPLLAAHYADEYACSALAGREPQALGFEALVESCHRQERFAQRVLEAVTRPVAEILLSQFTFDPEVERVILTGGVVHGLAPHYMDALHGNLERLGLYQVSERAPYFFQDRLEVGQADDRAGLLGAGLVAGARPLQAVRSAA